MATISSSETFAKRRAIFLSAKQWISKDIPSYGSQSKSAKIAFTWLGKYQEGGSVSIVFPYSPTVNSSLPVWRHIATGQSLAWLG